MPLEPKTFNFPMVNATIGFNSPSLNFCKVSGEMTSVVSAASFVVGVVGGRSLYYGGEGVGGLVGGSVGWSGWGWMGV